MRRALVILVAIASGGCSLVYSTSGLHDPDGSVPDSSTTDSSRTDSSTTDSSTTDGGCTATPPSVMSTTWNHQGELVILFDEVATEATAYTIMRGTDSRTVTLSMGSRELRTPYRIPLFPGAETMTITAMNGCGTPYSFTAITTDETPAGADSLSSMNGLPSVDIANDGTVVFVTNSMIGVDTAGTERIYRWAVGSAPASIVETGSDVITDGMTGVRISDDGAMVTYWQGNTQPDAITSGIYHYRVETGTGTRTGTIGPSTYYATSDIRNAGASSAADYIFAMTGQDGVVQDALLSDALTLGSAPPASIPLTQNWGRARVPTVLPGERSYAVAYAATPVAPGGPSAPARRAPSESTPVVATGCLVDSTVGLATADPTGGLWFVGTCPGTASGLVHWMSSGTVWWFDVDAYDGLLASDDGQTTFLLRHSSGGYAIAVIDASSSVLVKPLEGTRTNTPFLDDAALSPNGEWAVTAQRATGPGFRLGRIRVH